MKKWESNSSTFNRILRSKLFLSEKARATQVRALFYTVTSPLYLLNIRGLVNGHFVVAGACLIKALGYKTSARMRRGGRVVSLAECPDNLAHQVIMPILSRRLAESATRRALTKFTWHEPRKKLLEMYEKFLV